MKRPLIWTLAVIAVLGVGGFLAFQHYRLYLPGIIGNLKNPIQPNQPVVWKTSTRPATPAADAGQRPPNIILIVADDLGINDITSTGEGVAGGAVPTPAIDSISKTGVTFTNGYAGNATCSPSRAAMMTGRYPTRFGFEFTAVPTMFARNIASMGGHSGNTPPIFHKDRIKDVPPVDQMGVPASEVTIAETLKGAGYHTLHLGKWHLGESEGMRPQDQGFDESLGFYAGAAMFLPKDDPDVVNSVQEYDPIDVFLWANLPYSIRYNGSKPFRPNGYLTDYLGDEAVKAIQANKDGPFFMYLAFNAPHTPLQAKKEDYDALSGIKDHKLRVYAAMIRALDRNVGKVLAELERQGMTENTIVIFTSDNGGANYIGLPDINKPYRGFKATFFEGGIHVPFFVKWPGQIPAGTTSPARAMHFDVFTTAMTAAQAQGPGAGVLDGVDLVALSRGQVADRPLFFRSGPYRTVIYKDWKLQVAETPKKAWLFDLAKDPTEQVNVAAAMPDKVRELTALLDAQDRRAAKPLWPALIEGPIWIDRPTDGKPMPKDAEYIMWSN